MTAEIISVGTELLLGNIVNTNAAYLAEQCAMLGLSVYYQSVVGDNAGRLADTIRQAMDRFYPSWKEVRLLLNQFDAQPLPPEVV